MIFAKFAAAALVISIAAAPTAEPPASAGLSARQKSEAAQAYVDSAIECVARAVAADPRFRKDDPAPKLGALIADSLPKCREPMRAMIDAFDFYFGDGMGERFADGPYRAALPAAIAQRIADGVDTPRADAARP